jgi:hypothetical protein
MLCRLIFVLLAIFVAVTLFERVTAQVASDERSSKAIARLSESEDYTVLKAVLAQYYKDSSRPIVVEEFLAPCEVSSNFLRNTEKLIEPLRLAKMHNDCFLKPKLDVDVKQFGSKSRFVTIKNSHYRRLFVGRDCEDGWRDFYKHHPGSQGYVKFSRVGFDDEREFAILEFTYAKGCLDGEGHLFIMRKVKDNWQVANDSMLWVS